MQLYDLKPYLHISLDDYDNDFLLNSLYTAAKQVFTDLTDLQLTNNDDYDFEYFSYSNVDTIFFDMGPVNSINSVTYRYVFSDSMSTISSSEYELTDNVLRFETAQTFNKLVVNVDIGYSTIPTNIDFLLVQIVNHYFRFQANAIHLSSDGQVPLMPDEATLPKYLYDQIRAYRLNL